MHWQRIIPFVPLLAMLVVAAAADLRLRRIPNWLTLPLMLAGLTQSCTAAATVAPLASLLGLLAGGGLSLPMFVWGVRGGGDVKLLAATGTWLGPKGVLLVYLVAAVAGMLLVLLQCTMQGRLPQLLERTALVALNLRHVRLVGAGNTAYALSSSRTIEKPLPYAVPILIAVAVMLLRWRVGP
ncbi:MAG: A24 family peptidase [Tepidisphaeraceae bacterium]|jgi:prepilin peptidase CpaA